MKVQRNPECMIVNCAPPIELVAKVRTAIAGRMVPWWTRAGHKPSKRQRQMGVSFRRSSSRPSPRLWRAWSPRRRTLHGRRRCGRRGAKTTPSPRGNAGRNAAQSAGSVRNRKYANGRVCYLHTRPFFRHKNFSLASCKGENEGVCQGGCVMTYPLAPSHFGELFMRRRKPKIPVYRAFFACRSERRKKGESEFSFSTFFSGGR